MQFDQTMFPITNRNLIQIRNCIIIKNKNLQSFEFGQRKKLNRMTLISFFPLVKLK